MIDAAAEVLADERLLRAGVLALDGVAGVTTRDGVVTRAALPPGGPGIPLGTMLLAQSLFLVAAYWLGPAAGLPEVWG